MEPQTVHSGPTPYWPEDCDGTKLLPRYHRLQKSIKKIRSGGEVKVVDVIIRAGEKETPHTHPAPSVMLMWRPTPIRVVLVEETGREVEVFRRDHVEGQEHPIPQNLAGIDVQRMDPEPFHFVENLAPTDSGCALRATRVEFHPSSTPGESQNLTATPNTEADEVTLWKALAARPGWSIALQLDNHCCVYRVEGGQAAPVLSETGGGGDVTPWWTIEGLSQGGGGANINTTAQQAGSLGGVFLPYQESTFFCPVPSSTSTVETPASFSSGSSSQCDTLEQFSYRVPPLCLLSGVDEKEELPPGDGLFVVWRA